jgi:hypothetical protein
MRQFAFNNGIIKRRGRKTGPGTLAEGVTLVLAYVRNNEKFHLGVSGSFDRDEGDDGYSPQGVFVLGGDGLDGDNDGNAGGGDGDEHHYGRQAGRAEDQRNRLAGRTLLAGADRR